MIIKVNDMSYRSLYKEQNNKRTHIHSKSVTAGRTSLRLSWKVGRLLAALILIIIIVTGFTLVHSNALGTHAEPAQPNELAVTVSTGDTLWSLAQSHAPEGADIRQIVYLMKKRNLLTDSNLQPGDQIIIPVESF
ncbi:LysM peptidoglycan-binding domain-containing protein [Paenibacillus tarimensis]|uniref:LysM peptidoglycan-binding domain-containing protein n=1 Tax=Paenibacillus tarimensis TaxID=416012 RepID=UPI001F4097A8|nr:LysM peptidoglycan-binding domain-containing protein [Paenibacillus tarimensis]MCF2942665.1 LysM peptidoglycan-binding domain-containing protein [Paenibacillus tarimensis]